MKDRAFSFNDLPEEETRKELMEKKKQETIKKYGKPIRKLCDKEEMIRKWGKRK